MLGAKGAVSGLPRGLARLDGSNDLTGGAFAPGGLRASSAQAPVAKASPAPVAPVSVIATPPPQAAPAADATPQNFDPGAQAQQHDNQQSQEVEGRAAAERLQQAKTRIQMLQFRARSAAASGDSQEADRAAREAATVAREISQLAQQLTRSQGGGVTTAATGKEAATVRRHAGAGPDTRSVAQGLLADSAPRGQIPTDTTDGFLVEARTLASQARSLVDLASHLHDQGTASEPMFAPQTTVAAEGVATTTTKDAPPETGAWADLAAADGALADSSPVPAEPKKFAPAPGTLVKLSV